jgi:hypothetical protein
LFIHRLQEAAGTEGQVGGVFHLHQACSATIWVNARDNLDEWIDRASERIFVAVDGLGNT